MFNFRDALLRNIIQRALGIIKRKYNILASGCEYSIKIQVKLFPACATFHNFIVSMEGEGEWNLDTGDDDTDEEEGLLYISHFDCDVAAEKRML